MWADELLDAATSGRLFAMKVHVPLDSAGNVLDPIFELKNWNQIQNSVF